MSPEEALARYVSGLDGLEEALAGLSESDLDVSLVPAEWSIRQIVHHLLDGDDLWSMCLKVALSTSGACFQFGWYPGNDAWAGAMDYAGRGIEPTMVVLRARRAHIAQLLARFADRWDHCVTVIAPYNQRGEQMTVSMIVDLLVSHMDQHVLEIREIRSKHGF